jgi:hypothetical protein
MDPTRFESCKSARFSIINRFVSIRVLLGTSLLLLTLSAVFGVLNTTKVKSLRAEQESALAARASAQNVPASRQSQSRRGEASAGVDKAKLAETETRAANAEAEAAKARTEKATVVAKLQANESQLAQLQKKVEELSTGSTQFATSEGPSMTELQAQLAEARRQLDNAEREKLFLAEKTETTTEPRPKAVQEPTARRRISSQPGLHGTVLAVNQAYNFVVLNLGVRQGVETNAEMLVLRRGTVIGKIRVSSVEPATAIGDIISSTLPRGVQVQPGDTVVYAGTGS